MSSIANGRVCGSMTPRRRAGALPAGSSSSSTRPDRSTRPSRQARRRNLWLSFGILAVLAASVGLVVLNARRSERLAAQQMDFVATVSHELRTPLAVIRSAAQNLSAGVVHDARAGQAVRRSDRERGPAAHRHGRAGAGVRRPRATTGARRARAADAGRLVTRRRWRVAGRSSKPHGFDVAVDIAPARAAGAGGRGRDPARAPQPRHATRSSTAATGDGSASRSHASTSIDAGRRGADQRQRSRTRHRPDDLPHIFEPFYRGRYALDQQIHGNGLGLSLVKRIAEAHGGRVTVKSAPGAGLDVHAAPAGARRRRRRRRRSRRAGPGAIAGRSQRRPAERTLAAKRVLLVEDEPGLVLTLTDRLQSEGYEVGVGDRRPIGPRARHARAWDVILLDVMLPGASGFDVCRDLRQQGVTTPIIMLTARGQVVDKVLGLQARRRRLPDQAVRHARAARADRGADAPRARPAGTSRDASTGSATSPWTSARPRSCAPASRSSSPRASSCCSSTSSSTAKPRSPATSC